MKTCLFGGSFDPVHAGHLAIATAAQNQCQLDEVIFLPAACSPFKQGKTTYFDESQRLYMLEQATKDLSWAKVSELDLELPPPSWSWRIAEHWHKEHPESTLYWLMGTDQWEQLHRWARYDYLCELLHFIVYHRDTPPEPRPGVRSTFICTGMHPASSSGIREALITNTPVPEGWLHPDVETFIKQLSSVNFPAEEQVELHDLPEEKIAEYQHRADEQYAKDAHLSPEELEKVLFERACALLKERGGIRAESIQYNLFLGYAHTARLLDQMVERGIITPMQGTPWIYLPKS